MISATGLISHLPNPWRLAPGTRSRTGSPIELGPDPCPPSWCVEDLSLGWESHRPCSLGQVEVLSETIPVVVGGTPGHPKKRSGKHGGKYTQQKRLQDASSKHPERSLGIVITSLMSFMAAISKISTVRCCYHADDQTWQQQEAKCVRKKQA